MDASTRPLYARIATHYRAAIRNGALAPGEAMPSVRALTRLHQVSLSTALQACRSLEDEGLLQARPRSGYFVQKPWRLSMPPVEDPDPGRITPDAAQYVGIHDRVSQFVAMTDRYPATVDLAATYAGPEAYPARDLQRIATRTLRRDPGLLVRPIAPKGDLGLRTALARRALDMGMPLAPDQIVVTNGCIEALNIALRSVAQPGDTIAVESPTYYGLLQVLESLGLRSVEVATSATTGLSVDALASVLQHRPDIKAVVVVPNLHNPLGCTMPDTAKERLVALCEAHGVPLIEDDTYSALTDDDRPLKALKSWDTSGNVIHCASMRKVLAPGMRLGWMTGGRWQARIEMLKYAQSRANESLSQIAMAGFIASSQMERHLTRLRGTLRRQREQVADAIASHFPTGTRLSAPAGGMLLWVELPRPCSSQAVFTEALGQGIRIAPGHLFSNLTRFDHFIRVSTGTPFTAASEAGVKRLASIVKAIG